MLLRADMRPEELRKPGLRLWQDDRFAMGWAGHLHLPGEAADAPS